jgi:hypothetical protein
MLRGDLAASFFTCSAISYPGERGSAKQWPTYDPHPPRYGPDYKEQRGSASTGQAQDKYFDDTPNCGEMHLAIILL